MPRQTRRTLLTGLAAALAGCQSGGGSTTGTATDDRPASPLHRLAYTAAGAEVTGLFLGPAETLFMNVQHPSGANPAPYDRAAVGVFQRPLRRLPADFGSVQDPPGAQGRVSTSWGDYQVLAHGGDGTDDGGTLGFVEAPDGTTLTDPDSPDCNVYVPLDGGGTGTVTGAGTGDTGYLYTNWETKPGALSRLRIARSAPGEPWTVEQATNLDLRGIGGTWRPCFGSRSPWGTPLSAEELYYRPTARWNSPDPGAGVERLARYLGEFPNPYRYGYVVEVTDPTSASPAPVKQYTLGRFAHENALVLPDERTVYLSDDGTGTVLFKFVADEPGDLSAGTLYAARAAQTGSGDVASVGFDLQWLELAHATREQVAGWIAEYDDVTPDDYRAGETSYISDDEVRAWARGEAADDRVAFLESRRAAAARGATAEFRKMEGINARPNAQPGDHLYLSMSAVTHTMADDVGDIRTGGNRYGAVYRMELDADYDVHRMEPVVVGGESATVCGGCPYDAHPESSSTCASCAYNPQTEGGSSARLATEYTVANPDNLVVMRDGRVVVGEDTGLKGNDAVWVYEPPS